jgi:hypothetical protein
VLVLRVKFIAGAFSANPPKRSQPFPIAPVAQ